MLTDELIANTNFAILGSGRDKLVHDSRCAHRFDMDQDFAAAADELKRFNPAAFERALAACRLPFELCWFETAHSYRESFVAHGQRLIVQDIGVQRVGVLIRSLGSWDRWIVHLAWSFRDGRSDLSSTAFLIDLAGGALTDWFWEQAECDAKRFDLLSGIADVEAAARMERQTAPTESVYHKDIFERLRSQADGAAIMRRLGEAARNDWMGEPLYWIAAIALMNSRNAATTVTSDLDRLNRARHKRGQPELLSHTICRIAPRLKQRIARDRGVEEDERVIRSHFVRGHFKTRKSGVFWWSPFFRHGSGVGLVAKDYRLVGAGRPRSHSPGSEGAGV